MILEYWRFCSKYFYKYSEQNGEQFGGVRTPAPLFVKVVKLTHRVKITAYYLFHYVIVGVLYLLFTRSSKLAQTLKKAISVLRSDTFLSNC